MAARMTEDALTGVKSTGTGNQQTFLSSCSVIGSLMKAKTYLSTRSLEGRF
jgi:hypothetical protein